MPHRKETCPYCGNEHCEAEFTDVSVGFVQIGPYRCDACHAYEIGAYDNSNPTEDERERGWYAPNSATLPKTVSAIDGKLISTASALLIYRQGLVDSVPFHLTTTPSTRALLRALVPDEFDMVCP